MSFPTLDDIVATIGSTAAVDPAITTPSPVSGKLELDIFTATTTHNNPVVPSGFTYLVSTKPAGDSRSGDRDQILYKVLAGSEGTSRVIDTGTSSVKHHALSLLIGNIDPAVAPAISAAALGTSNSPNPPSLTPPAGARDYLWLWIAIMEGTVGDPVGSPTNYTRPTPSTAATTGGSAATNSRMMVAYRQLTGTVEDPPALTWPASEDWVAWTIAIAGPAAGGGGPSQAVRTMHQHRMRRMR